MVYLCRPGVRMEYRHGLQYADPVWMARTALECERPYCRPAAPLRPWAVWLAISISVCCPKIVDTYTV
jgi:hypothetical protein